MSFEFKLPEIGEGVTEGEVVKWLVKQGDQVKEDQAIVEIMTDKATMEIAAPREGKIESLLAKVGDTLKVGKGLIVMDGSAATQKEESAEPKESVPLPTTVPIQEPKGNLPLASPATRKLAMEKGIDLTTVHGSGPGGRILQSDLTKGSAAPPTPPSGKEERIPLRGIRKKIAERMTHSKHLVADFTHFDEIDMTKAVELRQDLKAKAESRGAKLTYLPFIMRAVSLALREHPRLNSSLDDQRGEIVVRPSHNIGIAVDNRDSDLVVPVVQNVETKSLFQLANDLKEISEKAREAKLTPSDLQGGTFTITSVGKIGGLFATPIVNHPEAAILGFYQIQDRPVVREGQIVIRKMAYASVSIDHRIVDGAMGAAFLSTVKQNLESPQNLFNLLDG